MLVKEKKPNEYKGGAAGAPETDKRTRPWQAARRPGRPGAGRGHLGAAQWHWRDGPGLGRSHSSEGMAGEERDPGQRAAGSVRGGRAGGVLWGWARCSVPIPILCCSVAARMGSMAWAAFYPLCHLHRPHLPVLEPQGHQSWWGRHGLSPHVTIRHFCLLLASPRESWAVPACAPALLTSTMPTGH